jgi:molybdopterin-biosynthesis enzyme MoeA-like protein
MAETVQQIATRLRATYPTLSVSVNGQAQQLNQAQYDSRIAEMAANERQAQLDAEAEALRKAERDQARAAVATLDTHITTLAGTPTNAQVVAAVLFLCRAMRRLIVVLMDRGIIEAA